MGGQSVEEGKDWTRQRIVALNPISILDIGAGSGTYAKLLRSHLRYAHFTGVEIHQPYIDRFDLRSQYDYVINMDILDLVKDGFPRPYDVVILGDVLEHVSHDEAIAVWSWCRKVAHQGVFLSLPIYGYEQGPIDGNDHETHLHQWSHYTVIHELPGIIDSWQGQIVGCYQAIPVSQAVPAS